MGSLGIHFAIGSSLDWAKGRVQGWVAGARSETGAGHGDGDECGGGDPPASNYCGPNSDPSHKLV